MVGNYKSNFGNNIKSLRKSAGYKRQQDFADAFGRSIDTIQNWEQGKTWPTMEDFLLLCDHFHCDADYLVGRIGTKTHDLNFICSETGLSERTATFFMKNQDLAKALDWLDPDQLRTFMKALDAAFIAFDESVEILDDPDPKNWGIASYQRISLEYSTMRFQDVCRRLVTEWCDMDRILATLTERENAYNVALSKEAQQIAIKAGSQQNDSTELDEQLFQRYLRALDNMEDNEHGEHTED